MDKIKKQLNLSIDTMGSDLGCEPFIQAVSACSKNNQNDTFFYLHGNQQKLTKLTEKYNLNKKIYKIIDSPNFVPMDMSPANAIRRLKDTSSMWQAIQYAKDKKSDGVISSGNTGALVGIAHILLRLLPRVDGPTIGSFWPNAEGINKTLLLDSGARLKLNPMQLAQLGYIGNIIMAVLLEIPKPKVSLINIGVEAFKGTKDIQQTHHLLEQLRKKEIINYQGFIEGSEVFCNKDLNVVITDGWTGNVMLKTAEGIAKIAKNTMESSFQANAFTKIIGLLLMRNNKDKFKNFDINKFYGGLIIGLNEIVLKTHGNSNTEQIITAIKFFKYLSEKKLLDKLKTALNEMPEELN